MRRFVLIGMLSVGLVLLSIAGIVTFQHFQPGKYITVRFSNVKRVSLVEFKTSRQIQTIENSGDKVFVYKDWKYQIEYTGNDGYATGAADIDNSKDEVTIKPYYSDKNLESMLNKATVDTVHSVIKKSYPKASQNYSIQRGKLHHYGEWYSTSLTYKKGYGFDSDTLRVVLKKVSGKWQVATEPDITLDRFTNPTVPVDILRQVNAF